DRDVSVARFVDANSDVLSVTRHARVGIRSGWQRHRSCRAVAIRDYQHSRRCGESSRTGYKSQSPALRYAQIRTASRRAPPNTLENGNCFTCDFSLFQIEGRSKDRSAQCVDQMSRWEIAPAAAIDNRRSRSGRQRLYNDLCAIEPLVAVTFRK